jgi:hypothetical protein
MALAHPSSASFAGTSLGGLLGFSGGSPSASATDVTSHGSAMQDGRVVKDYVCLAIESGSASVRLLGMPPFSPTDVGKQGALSITTPAGSLSATAILSGYSVEGEVGGLITGSCDFIILGT